MKQIILLAVSILAISVISYGLSDAVFTSHDGVWRCGAVGGYAMGLMHWVFVEGRRQ